MQDKNIIKIVMNLRYITVIYGVSVHFLHMTKTDISPRSQKWIKSIILQTQLFYQFEVQILTFYFLFLAVHCGLILIFHIISD